MTKKDKDDKEILKARQEANALARKMRPILLGNVFRKQITQLRPYTCVELWITLKGQTEKAIGFSKVQWPDLWDAKYGIQIATDKAIARHARQIVARDPSYCQLLVEQREKEKANLAQTNSVTANVLAESLTVNISA